KVASQAKEVLGADELDVVADRGYQQHRDFGGRASRYYGEFPKPMTSGAKSEGRFGKQDFVYLRGCVPLPGGSEAQLSLNERGGWQGAPVVDNGAINPSFQIGNKAGPEEGAGMTRPSAYRHRLQLSLGSTPHAEGVAE